VVGNEPTLPAEGTRDLGRSATEDIGGRYRVIRELGRGGMGVVYLARDPILQRDIALKICPDAGPKATLRMRREAKALAALRHPNVVEVYDVGESGDQLFIAMEFVAGGDARARFGRGALHPWREVLAFYLDAARGLAAAHRADIVHRDFKPGNVLCTRDGQAKVADFGLALATPSHGDDTPFGVVTSSTGRVTRAGAIVGTPAFMAPEQRLGLDVDARADQYAFCAALFDALFGRHPFPARVLRDRATGLTSARIHWPRDARRVPKHVRNVLERGLQVDPTARFDSMESLIDALVHRRDRRWLLPTMLGAVAVAGAVWLSPSPAETCALDPSAPWDTDRRAHLIETLRPTDRDFANAVVDDLDAFASAWTLQRNAACEASAQPAQSLCLGRLRDAFAARVALLATGDRGVLARARELTSSLPPPSTCDAPDPLLATAEDTLRQRELVRVLETAAANDDAGKTLDADTLAAQALGLARALDQPSLLARALSLRADIAVSRANGTLAAELYEEAYLVATAHGMDQRAAGAAMRVAPLFAERGLDERARRWMDVAATEVERAGDSVQLRVGLHITHAQTWISLGDYAAAERALDAADETLSEHDTTYDRYSVLATRSALLAVNGAPPERRTTLARERLELSTALFGPHHPDTAVALEDLGAALHRQRDWPNAIETLQRAREAFVAALGPNNIRLVRVDNQIGLSLKASGDIEAAETTFRRAIDQHRTLSTAADGTLVNLESNLGALLRQRGELEESQRHQERAVAAAEQTFGADALPTALVRTNLAAVLNASEHNERALAQLDRARAVFDSSLPERHPAHFSVALNTISGNLGLGRFHAAETTLERARTLAGDDPSKRAAVERLEGQLKAERTVTE